MMGTSNLVNSTFKNEFWDVFTSKDFIDRFLKRLSNFNGRPKGDIFIEGIIRESIGIMYCLESKTSNKNHGNDGFDIITLEYDRARNDEYTVEIMSMYNRLDKITRFKVKYTEGKEVDFVGLENKVLKWVADYAKNYRDINEEVDNYIKKFGVISEEEKGTALTSVGTLVTPEDVVSNAETSIKDNSVGAKILRNFVNKHLGELDSNHQITTFFIDTAEEYKKYNISVPGICLIVADKRATKATLKREPIVQKFDLSKTLKRYSDWKRGRVPNIDGEVWYTIYISAKDAREQGIKPLREEYYGRINEDGVVEDWRGLNEEQEVQYLPLKKFISKDYAFRVDTNRDIYLQLD